MSETPLNREELLRDSQATLREVAGVLEGLWDLPLVEPKGSDRPEFPVSRLSSGADVEQVLANTRMEVQALQESVEALSEALPATTRQAGQHESAGPGLKTARERMATRASELLTEVQARLNRLAQDLEDRGLGPE